MLVLSRKQEQQIQIGENVTITILQVKGRSVRIGIDAPKEMHIVRTELHSVKADTAASATSEAMPESLPTERPTPQSEQPPLRRRDRIRESRRSPAFRRRRLVGEASDGPLRRYLDEQGSGTQQAALTPSRRSDEQRHVGPLHRDLGGEAIVDQPQIELHLDPYQQSASPRHAEVAGVDGAARFGSAARFDKAARFDNADRFDDIDESPVLRALRWRA